MERRPGIAFLVAALVALTSGCRQEASPDPRVTEEMARFLEESPVSTPTSCADRAVAEGRLVELMALLQDVGRLRPRWDDPLPEDLLARLEEVDLLSRVDDFRCAMMDPQARADVVWSVGTFASLLVVRGKALSSGGNSEWLGTYLLAALQLFHDLPATIYLQRFSAFWVFQRVIELASEMPPESSDAGQRLEVAIEGAMLPRRDFCEGVREEFLAQLVALFPTHARPLKERILARYAPYSSGPEDFPAMVWSDRWATDHESLDVWRAFVALYTPILAQCAEGDPLALWHEAQPRLAELLRLAPDMEPLGLTVGRLKDYASLMDTERAALEALKGARAAEPKSSLSVMSE